MIDDASARKADTGAPSDALFGPSELHLRSLSASGDIRLSAPQIQIEAQDVAYDAQAELLTARGNERQPVELYNESGVSRGSFQEVVWDVRAEQIHRMREARGQVRR
jgi:lipopolysaccharide assembly outer membrane protein LptD (OstA)